MQLAQSKDRRTYPGPTEVETVQDLIDFLTKKVSESPSYRNDELFIVLGKKYHQMLNVSVVDDVFLIGIDYKQSKPFSHEE